jgi:hypothetical protein
MRWRPSAPARAITQSIAGAVGVVLVRRLDQLELDGVDFLGSRRPTSHRGADERMSMPTTRCASSTQTTHSEAIARDRVA